jgi:hypothetical protein
MSNGGPLARLHGKGAKRAHRAAGRTLKRRFHMKFAFLSFESPADIARRTGKDSKAYVDGWMAYGAALQQAGVLVSGAGLEPITTATTLRSKDGKRQVQDGPYADTKDQFGGFYIVDVPSLDVALEWASKSPCLPNGAIEVRPLIPFPPK